MADQYSYSLKSQSPTQSNSDTLKEVQGLGQSLKQRKRIANITQLKTIDFDDKSQLSLIQETGSSHSKTQDNSYHLIKFYTGQSRNQYSPHPHQTLQIPEASVPRFDTILSSGDNQQSRPSSNHQDQNQLMMSNHTEKLDTTYVKAMNYKSQNIQMLSPTANRQSTTIKMLSDREKFMLAKNNGYIDVLLELISSNDQVGSNSFLETSKGRQGSNFFGSSKEDFTANFQYSYQRNSNYNKKKQLKFQNDSAVTKSFAGNTSNGRLSNMNSYIQSNMTNNDVKSDLRKEWMTNEELVSHCALNQISYLLLQNRKELKLQIFYNLPEQIEKRAYLINMRNQILKHFEENHTIEKRMQKYLLMADDTGIQSTLFLLLVLSDDELKTSLLNTCDDMKSSLHSHSSQNQELYRQQSILSSSSKKRLNKPSGGNRSKRNSNSDFHSVWFKKNCNNILNSIDYLLTDVSFMQNTYRVSILLIGNLFNLNSSTTKAYVKKKGTYQKLVNFFDRERENMTEKEIIELENSLKLMYSQRELYGLTKRQKQISRLKDVYVQQIRKEESPTQQYSKLIRSDSSEDLMELIQGVDGNMSRDMLNTSQNQFQISTEMGNEVRDPFAMRVLVSSMDPSDYQQDGKLKKDTTLKQTELGHNVLHHIKKKLTINQPPISDQEHLNTSSQQISKKQPAQSDQFIMVPDKSTPAGSNNNHYLGSPQQASTRLSPSHQQQVYQNSMPQNSVLSHVKGGNDSGYNESPKNSKKIGSPVGSSFLDMRESFFVKDKSFFAANDRNHPNMPTDDNNSISSRQSRPRKSTKESKKRTKKPITKYESQTIEYMQSELKISRSNMKISDQSTMMNTKFNSNLRGNFDTNIRSTQNEYSVSNSCCICMPRRKTQKSVLKQTVTSSARTRVQDYVIVEAESKSSQIDQNLDPLLEEFQKDKSHSRSSINQSYENKILLPDANMPSQLRYDNFNSQQDKAYQGNSSQPTSHNNSQIKSVKVSFGVRQPASSSKKSTNKISLLGGLTSDHRSNNDKNSQSNCVIF